VLGKPTPNLKEFQAVFEWIGGVEAPDMGQGIIGSDWYAGCLKNSAEGVQISYSKGRMGLACRHKIGLDPQMDHRAGALEPATTARGQGLGFWHLAQAQQAGIESASLSLSAGGHGQQHVIEANNVHGYLGNQMDRRPRRLL
jgi:hypothetical protein